MEDAIRFYFEMYANLLPFPALSLSEALGKNPKLIVDRIIRCLIPRPTRMYTFGRKIARALDRENIDKSSAQYLQHCLDEKSKLPLCIRTTLEKMATLISWKRWIDHLSETMGEDDLLACLLDIIGELDEGQRIQVGENLVAELRELREDILEEGREGYMTEEVLDSADEAIAYLAYNISEAIMEEVTPAIEESAGVSSIYEPHIADIIREYV